MPKLWEQILPTHIVIKHSSLAYFRGSWLLLMTGLLCSGVGSNYFGVLSRSCSRCLLEEPQAFTKLENQSRSSLHKTPHFKGAQGPLLCVRKHSPHQVY